MNSVPEESGGEGGPGELPAGLRPAEGVPVNGHGTPVSLSPTAAIAKMMTTLPQALAQIIATVPVKTRQHLCAHCLGARLGWAAAHQAELRTATEAAAVAHGISPAGPFPPGFDPAPFLPEHLRPGGSQGIPLMQPAITTVSGTEVCADHFPGQPAGRQPLLIAHGSLTPSMLAQIGV